MRDFHACHQIGLAAYNTNKRLEAGKFFTAACLLGDKEACVDWNNANWGSGKNENLHRQISYYLSEEGNVAAHTHKAEYLLKEGNEEEARKLLKIGCEKDVSSSCLKLGELEKKSSILNAYKYLEKACSLSSLCCWKKDTVCEHLEENWEDFQKSGELEETRNFCAKLCKDEGREWACRHIGGGLYPRDAALIIEGKKRKEEGNLIGAAKRFAEVCNNRKNRFDCYHHEYICGEKSLAEFLDKNPSQEDKEEVAILCGRYCRDGNKIACDGLPILEVSLMLATD